MLSSGASRFALVGPGLSSPRTVPYRGLGVPLWETAGAAPTLDLNFAENRTLLDSVTGQNLVTFTRASAGTYVGSDGLIKTAPENVPRFDHNPVTGESLGLLVEEQRANLLLRSEEFGTTWIPSNASVASNSTAAPDGTISADKLTEDSSASTVHRIQQTVNFAAATVTYSVYLKAASRNFALLVGFNGTNNRYIDCKFNLVNGTVDTIVNGSAAITPAGNGWYRCSVTAATTVTANNILYVYAASVAGGGANYESYTGDGTSGIYIWGAQLEAGTFPTSYIPTTDSAATRSADVASITGSAFSSWYRQDEGTFFVNATVPQPSGGNRRIAFATDGTGNNRVGVLFNSSNNPQMLVSSGG